MRHPFVQARLLLPVGLGLQKITGRTFIVHDLATSTNV
jgi:hypothetical protein